MVEPRNHKADVKVLKPLDLVHTDSSGCVIPASYESSKYYITFVDDYSNMTIVYYLKNKSDTAAGAYPGFRQGGGTSLKIIVRSKIYNLDKNCR